MNYTKLHNALENNSISITELFKKIGVSKSAFYYSLNNRTIKVETLEKICEVLNVPIYEFFNSIDMPAISEPGAKYKVKNIDYKKALEVCQIENKALQKQIDELKALLLK